MLDCIIRNGIVVDGTGNNWYRADVGIADGVIAAVGDLREENAKHTICADGLVVAPGFIDIHTHSDFTVTANSAQDSAVHQGVTTEVIGNCGFSMYPVEKGRERLIHDYIGGFSPMDEIRYTNEAFFDYLRKNGHCANLVPLIGHSVVKLSVMGFETSTPTEVDMQKMTELLRKYFRFGVRGISNCLIFAPGVYTQKEELIQLCRVASEFGGFCATHIRSESNDIEAALDEALEIGRLADIPIHISHHKAACKPNWGKSAITIAKMENARAHGQDVTCDVYPYLSTYNMLRGLLPNWLMEGDGVQGMLQKLSNPEIRARVMQQMTCGENALENTVGWDKITAVSLFTEADKKYQGMTLDQIGKTQQKHPCEALMDTLIAGNGQGLMVVEMMDESDLIRILRFPYASIASDSWSEERARNLDAGKVHPRCYGSFARVLGRYVRELGVLRLEDAIRKMTSLSAHRLGLHDRGLIANGYAADIAVFDPAAICDTATYTEPRQFPTGMEYVLVNGQAVVEKGEHTGKLPGKMLLNK